MKPEKSKLQNTQMSLNTYSISNWHVLEILPSRIMFFFCFVFFAKVNRGFPVHIYCEFYEDFIQKKIPFYENKHCKFKLRVQYLA